MKGGGGSLSPSKYCLAEGEMKVALLLLSDLIKELDALPSQMDWNAQSSLRAKLSLQWCPLTMTHDWLLNFLYLLCSGIPSQTNRMPSKVCTKWTPLKSTWLNSKSNTPCTQTPFANQREDEPMANCSKSSSSMPFLPAGKRVSFRELQRLIP